jgi:hypothetical protein
VPDRYDVETLTADLAGIAPITSDWRRISDQPTRRLRSYAVTTGTAWQLLEPWWRSVRQHLERDTERIGVAAVRGELDTVFNTPSRRITVADGVFHLDGTHHLPLGDRRLVLVPSILRPDGLFLHRTVWVAPPPTSPPRPWRRPGTATCSRTPG